MRNSTQSRRQHHLLRLQRAHGVKQRRRRSRLLLLIPSPSDYLSPFLDSISDLNWSLPEIFHIDCSGFGCFSFLEVHDYLLFLSVLLLCDLFELLFYNSLCIYSIRVRRGTTRLFSCVFLYHACSVSCVYWLNSITFKFPCSNCNSSFLRRIAIILFTDSRYFLILYLIRLII